MCSANRIHGQVDPSSHLVRPSERALKMIDIRRAVRVNCDGVTATNFDRMCFTISSFISTEPSSLDYCPAMLSLCSRH